MVMKIAFIGDLAKWFTYPFMAKALVWRLVTHYVEQDDIEILIRRRRQESVETWIDDLCKQTWIPCNVIDVYLYTNSEAILRETTEKIFKPSSLVVFIYGDKPRKIDVWLRYECICDKINKPYHVYSIRDSCREIHLLYEVPESSFKPLERFNLTGEKIARLMRSIRDSIRQSMNRKLYKPPPL